MTHEKMSHVKFRLRKPNSVKGNLKRIQSNESDFRFQIVRRQALIVGRKMSICMQVGENTEDTHIGVDKCKD